MEGDAQFDTQAQFQTQAPGLVQSSAEKVEQEEEEETQQFEWGSSPPVEARKAQTVKSLHFESDDRMLQNLLMGMLSRR